MAPRRIHIRKTQLQKTIDKINMLSDVERQRMRLDYVHIIKRLMEMEKSTIKWERVLFYFLYHNINPNPLQQITYDKLKIEFTHWAEFFDLSAELIETYFEYIDNLFHWTYINNKKILLWFSLNKPNDSIMNFINDFIEDLI